MLTLSPLRPMDSMWIRLSQPMVSLADRTLADAALSLSRLYRDRVEYAPATDGWRLWHLCVDHARLRANGRALARELGLGIRQVEFAFESRLRVRLKPLLADMRLYYAARLVALADPSGRRLTGPMVATELDSVQQNFAVFLKAYSGMSFLEFRAAADADRRLALLERKLLEHEMRWRCVVLPLPAARARVA